MATITKKELIDRIADSTQAKRVQVKKIVQQFLDEVVAELGKGNRLEFRDFGVFETKLRKARKAQNPKTLEPVEVPEKRTVKFKVGRLMKQRLGELSVRAAGRSELDLPPLARRQRVRPEADGAPGPDADRRELSPCAALHG